MVQPDRQQADQQECAQHHPEDARATQEIRFESFKQHDWVDQLILGDADAKA